VPQKAIKLKEYISGPRVVLKPYVDENTCVGCGICQNKCPVRPVRAIKVSPENSTRF
jgi:Pyruvate/2-oxoacid:ferredoxin oxidoreductase delta subunit